jgi:hypothetical protein
MRGGRAVTLAYGVVVVELLVLNPLPLAAMQFQPVLLSQVSDTRHSATVVPKTVTVRWIPLVTAACSTRVARPARASPAT